MATNNEYVYVRCEKYLTFQVKKQVGTFQPIWVPCPADCPRKKAYLCRKTSFFSDTFREALPEMGDSVDYIFDSTAANSVPQSVSQSEAVSSQEEECSQTRMRATDTESSLGSSFAESETRYAYDQFDSDGVFADTSQFLHPTREGSYDGNGREDYRERAYNGYETNNAFAQNDRPYATNDRRRVSRSIFVNLKPLGDEPCFVDGVYMFYEKDMPYSAGNSQNAMEYIFSHWYTSAVFMPNEVTFTEDFLQLMKLRGLESREAEIVAIAENRELSINQKFFRLFYQIVYDGKRTEFYWHETESPINVIVPLLASREEFYKQLLLENDPNNYIKMFSGCMDELITYLTAGKPLHTDDHVRWFKRQLTLRVASDEGEIAFFDGRDDSLELCRLGRVADFVKGMSTFVSFTPLRQKKLNFLREFRITPSYHVEARETPLEESRETDSSDDESIYKGIGISPAFSNVYATVYNEYVTMLKEYMDTFKPSEVRIGVAPYDMVFTKKGFKSQLEDILWDAGQYIEDNADAWRGRVETVKYYMTRSLLIRGVFDDYLSQSEFKKMDRFIERFYRTKKMDRRMYFSLPVTKGKQHKVTLDTDTLPIRDYVRGMLTGNPISDQEKMAKNSVVNDYLDARKEDVAIANIVQEKKNRINAAIEAYQKALRDTEA